MDAYGFHAEEVGWVRSFSEEVGCLRSGRIDGEDVRVGNGVREREVFETPMRDDGSIAFFPLLRFLRDIVQGGKPISARAMGGYIYSGLVHTLRAILFALYRQRAQRRREPPLGYLG